MEESQNFVLKDCHEKVLQMNKRAAIVSRVCLLRFVEETARKI